jgi:hypothetical protein
VHPLPVCFGAEALKAQVVIPVGPHLAPVPEPGAMLPAAKTYVPLRLTPSPLAPGFQVDDGLQ